MTALTLQFVFRVIQVHQIWDRSPVFGVLVQALRHLSNIHSDTSVQKNQQAPWVLISKRKIKKIQKKKKTLQNSLAKAPKMQRELKYHFDRRAGVTVQTKNTQESEVKWKAVCVLSSESASTSKHFHAHWLWPLDTILQSLAINSDGWKLWHTTWY